MKRISAVLAGFLLISAFNGCASFGKNTKQLNQDRKNLKVLVKQGEVVLVTIENNRRELVPICGEFLDSNEKGIYLYHLDGERFYENINKINDTRTNDWFRDEDWPAMGIEWKYVRYVEYCFKNTADRKPLYYDP